MIHVLERFSWREWTRMLSESNFSCGICGSFPRNSEEFYPVTGCGSEFFPEGRTANGAPLYRGPDWIWSAIHSICWSPKTVKKSVTFCIHQRMACWDICWVRLFFPFVSRVFLPFTKTENIRDFDCLRWSVLNWFHNMFCCSFPCESPKRWRWINVAGADDPRGDASRYLYFDHCASGTFRWILSGGSCEGETSAATGPPLGDADACDFAKAPFEITRVEMIFSFWNLKAVGSWPFENI